MKRLNVAKTKLEKEVQRIINSNADGDVKGYIQDVINYGCASGIVGDLIYYADTTAFYERHKDEIWDLVTEASDEMGYSNPYEFLASLNGAKDVGNKEQSEGLLAWFAFEEVARKLGERSGLLIE